MILLIFFPNVAFTKDVVLNCEFILLVKQPNKDSYEQYDNRNYLITIKNNKEIYLDNITANQKDDFPFIIQETNQDYVFAILDKYNEINTEWIETLTLRKKDNFILIYHQSTYGYSTKYGHCRQN